MCDLCHYLKCKTSALTGEYLESYLCQCGQSVLVEHADAAHLLNLSRVHSLPSDRLQDVPYRCRLLECSLEEVCQNTHDTPGKQMYIVMGKVIWRLSNLSTLHSLFQWWWFNHSLLTGTLFCDVLGCWGGGVCSWLSSFLERTSLKSVRMTATPHKYWSCLVTRGIDSFRLQWTEEATKRKSQIFPVFHFFKQGKVGNSSLSSSSGSKVSQTIVMF